MPLAGTALDTTCKRGVERGVERRLVCRCAAWWVHTHVEKNDSLFLLSSLNTPFQLTPSTSPGGGMAALTTEPAEPGEDDNEAEDDEDDVIDIYTSTLPGGGTAAVSPSSAPSSSEPRCEGFH